MTDAEKHLAYTGVPLAPILNNLHTLDDLGVPVLLRAPIIPGLNDRKEHLLALKELRHSTKSAIGIQLMPYHTLGAYKYRELSRDYPCSGILDPTPETVALWRSIAES